MHICAYVWYVYDMLIYVIYTYISWAQWSYIPQSDLGRSPEYTENKYEYSSYL